MLERQREGVAKAKAEGKYKGRAPIARAKAPEVRQLHKDGVGATEIARRLQISRASVYRVLGPYAACKPCCQIVFITAKTSSYRYRSPVCKTLPMSPVQIKSESCVPLTGVNSAPVGVWMIAPSLISNWSRITLVLMAIPSRALIRRSASSEHVGIKELFCGGSSQKD